MELSRTCSMWEFQTSDGIGGGGDSTGIINGMGENSTGISRWHGGIPLASDDDGEFHWNYQIHVAWGNSTDIIRWNGRIQLGL